MKIQCIGIDVSKDKFDAKFCKNENGTISFKSGKQFKNVKSSFASFLKWAKSCADKDGSLCFLMEATGVYHECLAYFLHQKGEIVHIVLPNKSKHYFGSHNIKTKTDKIDAKVLSQFGVERKHDNWTPPKQIFKELRDLCRYKLQLNKQKTYLQNIKHSKEFSAEMDKLIMKSNEKMINHLKKEISYIAGKIEALIASDQDLAERVRKLCTVKGIAIQTIAVVIGETNGFEHFLSIKQLTSFAGYDIVHNQSGTSVFNKSRISKKGNKYIRAALFMPAMSASKHVPEFAILKQRIKDRTHIPMKAQVAVQRKSLALLYTLWKNETEYIPNYNEKKVA